MDHQEEQEIEEEIRDGEDEKPLGIFPPDNIMSVSSIIGRA